MQQPDASLPCPECGGVVRTRGDGTENCSHCGWWAPLSDRPTLLPQFSHASPTIAPRVVAQSRRGSAAEALVNVMVGYLVAVAAQAVVFPLFGIHLPAQHHLAIGALFTVVSLVRSYLLRRAFNAWALRRAVAR